MFGFGKKAKVSSAVGRSLHRQMRRALEHDQEKSNERMLSTFTAGYLMGYTQSCYSLEGYDGARLMEKNLKKILSGVFPRLPEIFEKAHTLMELNTSIKSTSVREKLERLEQEKLFTRALLEQGIEAGGRDSVLERTLPDSQAVNWFWWLTAQEKWEDIEEISNESIRDVE